MCYYYNAGGEDEICTFTTTGKFLTKPNESACKHWTLCTHGALCWKDVRDLTDLAYKMFSEDSEKWQCEGQQAFYEEVIRRFNKL